MPRRFSSFDSWVDSYRSELGVCHDILSRHGFFLSFPDFCRAAFAASSPS